MFPDYMQYFVSYKKWPTDSLVVCIVHTSQLSLCGQLSPTACHGLKKFLNFMKMCSHRYPLSTCKEMGQAKPIKFLCLEFKAAKYYGTYREPMLRMIKNPKRCISPQYENLPFTCMVLFFLSKAIYDVENFKKWSKLLYHQKCIFILLLILSKPLRGTRKAYLKKLKAVF